MIHKKNGCGGYVDAGWLGGRRVQIILFELQVVQRYKHFLNNMIFVFELIIRWNMYIFRNRNIFSAIEITFSSGIQYVFHIIISGILFGK
jgi:hypothetical protein